MPLNPAHMPGVVIITALPVEYAAVRSYLTALTEVVHPEGTIYECGIYSRGLLSWNVALVEISSGSITTAAETERALAYFKPDVALFVGIAGGLQGVNIGDVVAATKVCGYEFIHSSGIFVPTPDIGYSTHRMKQRAQAEARKSDWLQSLELSPKDTVPRIYIAPIVAGEKIITSHYADAIQFLSTQYSDALAVELEGHGFLKTTQVHQSVEALIVRGISSILDAPKYIDKIEYNELAAKHASAFAFEILAKVTLSESRPTTDDVRHASNKSVSTYNNTFTGPIQNNIQGDHTRIHVYNTDKISKKW